MKISMRTWMAGLFTALVLALAFTSCDEPQVSRTYEAQATYNGSIRVSLAHPFDVQKNDYEMLFAANVSVTALGLCLPNTTPTCTPGAQGYFPGTLLYTNGTKNFFKTTDSALLQDGLVMEIIGSDATGKIVDSRRISFSGSAAATTTPAATTTTPAATTTTPAATTTTPAATTPATTTVPSTGGGSQGGGVAGGFGGGGGGW